MELIILCISKCFCCCQRYTIFIKRYFVGVAVSVVTGLHTPYCQREFQQGALSWQLYLEEVVRWGVSGYEAWFRQKQTNRITAEVHGHHEGDRGAASPWGINRRGFHPCVNSHWLEEYSRSPLKNETIPLPISLLLRIPLPVLLQKDTTLRTCRARLRQRTPRQRGRDSTYQQNFLFEVQNTNWSTRQKI